MALASTVLIGFAGLGVDVASWQTTKRDMQGAADQAAYSAVVAVNAGGAAKVNAQAVAAQMGFVGSATNCAKNSQTGVTVCVNNPPTQGAYKGYSQGWEVFIAQPQQTFLSRVFLTSVTASAHAVALSQIQGDFCILQKNPGKTFTLSGTGATVNTSNGNIQANSTAAAAVCNGNQTINTNILAVVGGTSCKPNVTGKVVSPATSVSDPYANTTAPTADCTGNGNGFQTYGKTINGTATLTPTGSPAELVWCDSQGLDFSGTANVTLNPGIYILTQGVLKINAGANLTGTGVTFVLEGTASVDIAGGASVNLSAPLLNSGSPMAGLVFFQPSSDTQTATINGNSGTVALTGSVYFGGADVNYSGGSTSSASTSGCTQLIGGAITLSGNTTFADNCSGITQTISGSAPQLAE